MHHSDIIILGPDLLQNETGAKPMHSMSAPLPWTKTSPPCSPAKLLRRPRVMRMLEEGAKRKVVLLTAPAGFGKTSLLTTWVREGSFQVGWLSLDERDNDLSRFLTGLSAALSPESEERLTLLSRSPRFSSPEIMVGALLGELSETLRERDLVVVLDDYHFIQESVVHRALTTLLEQSPPRVHFVIASRTIPPLPLARLKAYDLASELSAEDLEFSGEEIHAFLNEVMEVPITLERAERLQRQTEGWITALKLMLHSNRPFEGTEFATDRHLFDYLSEEIFDRQPEAIQRFLLQTARLSRFNAPLCDAVAERDDSQEVLEQLEKDNLFIVPLDDERTWYRYHHLFSDFLRTRLRRCKPEWRQELDRRVCASYRENGMVEEAIDHALQSRDYELAASWIEETSRSMLMRNEVTTLLRWLEALPDDFLRRSTLRLAYAWGLAFTGRFSEVETWLEEESGEVLAIRAYCASIRASSPEDIQRVIEWSARALERLPEEEVFLRSLVSFGLGSAYGLHGELDQAIPLLESTIGICQRIDDLSTTLHAYAVVALLKSIQGKLREAAFLAEQAITLAARGRKQFLPAAGGVFESLGIVTCEWNDLEKARAHFATSIHLSERWNQQENVLQCRINLSRVHWATGDRTAMEENIAEIERLLLLYPHDRLEAEGVMLRSWLAFGEQAKVERWFRERSDSSHVPAESLRESEQFNMARVLLANRKPDQALAIVSPRLASALAAGRGKKAIEALALQSLAFFQKGELDSALKALANALRKGEPEGFCRTFLDEGEPMARLLSTLASPQGKGYREGVSRDYLERLLGAFKNNASMRRKEALLLSSREHEVLHLIFQGKKNGEIADELCIELSTVKKHISNIFDKLGAETRVQALRRAQELGIIDFS